MLIKPVRTIVKTLAPGVVLVCTRFLRNTRPDILSFESASDLKNHFIVGMPRSF